MTPTTSTNISLHQRPVSLDSPLHRLPTELFDLVLNYLDMQPCAHLSSTSFQCYTLVQYNPIYRENITFAWRALLGMTAMGLIPHHKSQKLHNILRDTFCAACPAYGTLPVLTDLRKMLLGVSPPVRATAIFVECVPCQLRSFT